ncbi:MAG: hypothetical protein HY427_00360 [Candidatus Levybacteria bacterium]|nr:hypothetical protein [Candidatus Levybacteria bacterium]
MRYSKLFGKTIRGVSSDEPSKNAKLLTRGGFVRREVAGVYNYLPLGLRVLNKISNIVREEMDKTGAQEVLLSALQNKANWEKTGRWDSFDALYKVKSRQATEYALGPTHEEVLVPLVRQFVSSYRDLPLYLYQIQVKFRDEARAKSGVLRSREFLMKDLYSFNRDEQDFDKYYDRVINAYKNIFKKSGVEAVLTEASGGEFSKFSHEFQVLTENGEDEIIYCPGGDFSQNVEIARVKEGKQCDLGHGPLKKSKSIEVGNIFPLKTRFSDAFGLTYKGQDGKQKPVIMGCYGLGISRLMGAIVEVHNDEKGIIWPKEVAPFDVHLVHIEDPGTESWAKGAYEKLTYAGIDALWDDRENVSAGEKFADADLIGIPVRLVISKKVGEGEVEWKNRDSKETKMMSIDETAKKLTS